MNGSGKLVFWILSGLLGLVMVLASGWAANTHERIDALEEGQKNRVEAIYELRNQIELLKLEVHGLRCDLCRRDEKFDDYRERHGERVYRTPCVSCP